MLSIILFSIFYFGIILLFIKKDTVYLLDAYYIDSLKYEIIQVNFLKRILLALLEHISGIFYFVTCLLYAKKKKVTFYSCGVMVILLLVLCIRFNLPLLLRESFFRINWETDIVEYFYPVAYLGMLIFFVFYPAFFDFLQRFSRGKSIVIWMAVLEAISINTITTVYVTVYTINERLSYDYLVVFLAALFIKVGLLILIYKFVLLKKEMKAERQKLKSSFVLKCIIPFVLVLGIIVMNVTVIKGGIVIRRAADIDGYWYIGGLSQFIEEYENPYEDKRHYLDFTYISEGKLEKEQEGYDWYYNEKEEYYMIKTYERKLESIYYVEPFGPMEWEESNLHKSDLEKFSLYYTREQRREYRTVLSSEEYKNQYFCYKIEYLPFGFNGNVTVHGYEIRDIEEYDIKIGGKEIPAYFLGMVEKFGIIKVEPYTHYWGENYFRIFGGTGELFWPRRQY